MLVAESMLTEREKQILKEAKKIILKEPKKKKSVMSKKMFREKWFLEKKTSETKKKKILRWKQKKMTFKKRIRYGVRQKKARKAPRVNGRFI
jgi:hypothetical protein